MIGNNSRGFRYALLFMLAMTEVMPLALVGQTLPVLMRRSGASMQEIGMVFLAMFPWTLKAVWAPLVDKLGARSSLGRYRSWLLLTHPLLVVTLLLGSLADVPALLTHNRAAILPMLLWLTSVCAMADAASHGMAVTLLSPEDRGIGNGLQTAGLMLGNLVGGGLMVILVGTVGWQAAVLVIAGIVLLTIPCIAIYREPLIESARTISLHEVFTFFRQARKVRWLVVVAMMPLGVSLVAPATELLLVDRGYSLKEIGLVLGVLSSAAGIAGGMFGGVVVKSLGRQRAFYLLNIFCALCMFLLLLNRVASGRPLLYLVIVLPSLGIMARATVLHVLMMDRCRSHVASTDFTIQYTLQQLSRFAASSAGAFLVGFLGSSTVFVTAALLTLAVVAVLARFLDHRDFRAVQPGLSG